jgi:hypothetical protein
MRAKTLATLALALVAFVTEGDLSGQEQGQGDVPIWPATGRIPTDMEGQFVFMADDGHALVVRFPVDGDGGQTKHEIVRVSLHNNLDPSVELELKKASSDVFRYQYRVCNGTSATDRIETCMQHEPGEGAPWNSPCWEGNLPKFKSTSGRSQKSWVVDSESVGIGPGSCLGGFVLDSDFLPGLKRGVFSALLVRFNSKGLTWPEEVEKQLSALSRYSWFVRYAPTVAPQFPPNTARSEVLEHYAEGLRGLVQDNWLDPSSDFVKELQEQVEKMRENPESASHVSLNAAPSNAIEEQILSAMEVSLRYASAR